MLELIERIRFWLRVDRLGPDIPLTHWLLFFPRKAIKLCKKKFLNFDSSAEFRPGAYAINCSKISIGKRVVIRPNTMLFGNADIIIDDDVMLGSGVHIYTGNHAFTRTDIPIIDQGHLPGESVKLKKGCWVGANSIILPGVTIGENSVIAAGSVVTRDIPPYVLAAGVPAVIKRNLNYDKKET